MKQGIELHCGNGSMFGAGPIPRTKCQGISASAALISIFFVFYIVYLLLVP